MKKVMKEALHLTGDELGEMLDLSKSRISQLKSAGIFAREPDGLYDLTTCLMEYERFLRRPSGLLGE